MNTTDDNFVNDLKSKVDDFFDTATPYDISELLGRWPKCTVLMRNGSTVAGEIADARETESTVRISAPPKPVPGAYGLQSVDYQYLDVRNEFITLS